jgi:hypothetical protein
MAMPGWSRRSRRGSPAESDAAFASAPELANAPRRAELSHGEHEVRSERARRELSACSASCMVAEQAGTKLGK